MSGRLTGHRIAFLVAPDGAEQVELTEPWQAVTDAGGEATLVSLEPGGVQLRHHLDPGDTLPVDTTVRDTSADDFDALVLPGGVANPDRLRTDADAVAFTAAFFAAGKPVAAICHAPWTLVEADMVRGRELTSYPSLRTDIVNAGGRWRDDRVVNCVNGRNVLVTSRRPADLPAFCGNLVEAFAHAPPWTR